MSFLDIVSKFNRKADSHTKSQSLNPFSEQFEQSRSPSPRFSREEYGKPVAGSKTDLRGRKAKSHICREILELCTVIHDVGTYNANKRSPDDDDDDHHDNNDDGTIIISFGELFQIYTKISDKVVGLLIAAKRRGFVYFDREILFQRRDDDVLIALLKPISEISKILKDDISQANTPAPTEPAVVEKKKSSSIENNHQVKPENNKKQEKKTNVDNCTKTAFDQLSKTSGVNGETDVAVLVVINGENNENKINCNGEVLEEEKNIALNNVIQISEINEDDSCIQACEAVEVSEVIVNKPEIAELDEPKNEEINQIKTEKVDEILTEEVEKAINEGIDNTKYENLDDAKIEVTDETKTEEINETKTEKVGDSSEFIENKSTIYDSHMGGEDVREEVENEEINCSVIQESYNDNNRININLKEFIKVGEVSEFGEYISIEKENFYPLVDENQ